LHSSKTGLYHKQSLEGVHHHLETTLLVFLMPKQSSISRSLDNNRESQFSRSDTNYLKQRQLVFIYL